MARRGTLEEIARQQNEPLETLIPRIVHEEGSFYKAAMRLGVYPNALQKWAEKNGYRLTVSRTVQLDKIEAENA